MHNSPCRIEPFAWSRCLTGPTPGMCYIQIKHASSPAFYSYCSNADRQVPTSNTRHQLTASAVRHASPSRGCSRAASAKSESTRRTAQGNSAVDGSPLNSPLLTSRCGASGQLAQRARQSVCKTRRTAERFGHYSVLGGAGGGILRKGHTDADRLMVSPITSDLSSADLKSPSHVTTPQLDLCQSPVSAFCESPGPQPALKFGTIRAAEVEVPRKEKRAGTAATASQRLRLYQSKSGASGA